MGILDSLEQRLDKLVNGSFSKAFKSDVQPTELGAVIQQEIDSKAKEVEGVLTAPNLFIIDLGANDFERLSAYLTPLAGELETLARDYSGQQRYALRSRVSVTFQRDEALDTGLFRVTSGIGEAPVQQQPAVAATDGPNPGSVVMIGEQSSPKLTSVNGKVYQLTQAISKIGRSEQAEIQIEDAGVSRLHCAIILGSQVIIKDLGSTNGTVVDGKTITEAVLNEGSIINIGSSTLTYSSR